jgi:phosphate transport system substrate-binding protein
VKKRWLLVGGAVVFSLLAGCGGGAANTVTALGSTSMEKVVGILAEQYQLDHSEITVSVEGGGSSAGVERVANGTADIGLASRALKETEADGLTGTVLALDGIAVIVSADNPVSDLTAEEIGRIFDGTITNWAQVGGVDGEIACIGREAGSGTREGFESITGTSDRCVLVQELTSTGAVVEAVRGNGQAIGYTSLSAAEGQAGVKLLTVGGVACSEETVLDGSYAIQRPFLLVTRTEEPLSEAAQGFFDWATSEAASDLIRQAGAVPVASFS